MPVDKHAEPFKTRGVEVSGPHTAQLEQELIRQTEVVTWRMGAGRNQWVCPNPMSVGAVGFAAPQTAFARITAVNTWTDFVWKRSSTYPVFKMPYMMSEGFEKIYGRVWMVTEITARLVVRLLVETLFDEIDTTNGAQSNPGYPTESSRMLHWSWMQAHSGQRFYRIVRGVKVLPSDLPDGETPDRCVLIRPQVKLFEEDYDVYAISGAAEARVYLQGLDLLDVPAESVGV